MEIPGFVDLQVNGFVGVDFSAFDLAEDRFRHACREVLRRGTAAFLPTLITRPDEVYERNLPVIARVMAEPEFEDRLLGIHLEGPFLSSTPGAVGAHNPDWTRSPSPAFLDQLQKWAAGRIRLITIAAELDGAEELARHAVAQGVAVSLGHHTADEQDLARLAGAGATALTHLGNGLPNRVDRHRNPLWAGLAEDALTATIIADGHHLPPSVLKAVIRTKGADRVVVVSDASPFAGLPPGRYATADNAIVLEESGRLHNPEKGCLVGSSVMMIDCMNHLASLGLLDEDELVRVGFANPLRLAGVAPGRIRSDSPVAFDPAARTFRLVRRPRA